MEAGPGKTRSLIGPGREEALAAPAAWIYPVAMTRRPRELDTVRLRKPVGTWPAGTEGVVVGEDPGSALVEVVTEHLVDTEGLPVRDLLDDLVDVDYGDLEILSPIDGSAP
jgi:hypothetical protein